MSVSESKSRRPAVIACRPIYNCCGCEVRITVHFRDKISVINAVLSLIKDDEGHRRARPQHFRHLAKDYRTRRTKTPISFVAILGRVAVPTHPVAHRDAPDARHALI